MGVLVVYIFWYLSKSILNGMKKLLFTLLLLVSFPVMASHIVGGEFELLHISGSTYRLNLILYFDKKNGSFGAKDQTVIASIFRKSDNVFIRNVTLPLTSESDVSYMQPACSDGEIQTLKLTYTALVDLNANDFADPGGYYVSWQRCCRNYSIDNIYSPVAPSPPTTNPFLFAGQTFYLEFPPVVKNGEPFIDSSPKLFPPLNDYACPNKPYYTDFAGEDEDGDSLVYSLVTPLSTFTSDALPIIAPGPYPEVKWKDPYSLTNIINGLPDLRISTDGLLTCTPRTQGLFVFAVKVEEFRDKEKIGESRRDFQMLVLDKCPVASPPVITGKKLTDASFTYLNKMSVSFDNTVTDANRCIEVRVSDLDASKPDQGNMEFVSIRVVGLNFKNPKLNQILPSVSTAVLMNGSTADFRICFPQCPYFDGPYEVGIVVSDDACTQPLTDTLRVTVNTQPPLNRRPKFVTPDLVTAQITEGDTPAPWPFQVTDADLDDLVLSYKTDGFKLEDYGMSLTYTQQKGLVNGQIVWDPRCNVFDFTKRTEFNIQILVDDKDQCGFGIPDTAVYKLKIKLPGNSAPVIDTDITSDPEEKSVWIPRKILETVEFNVTGKDIADNDLLVLGVKGIGFNLSDYAISFPTATANGTVTSKFSWDIGCFNIDLKKKSTYTFQFTVVDNANKCRFYKADTVTVDIKFLEPDNAQPLINIVNPSNIEIGNSTVEYTLGKPIEFTVQGTDTDVLRGKDNLSLTLMSATGKVPPTGFTFLDKSGKSPVSSVFTWTPDCSIFKNGVYENEYEFKFSLIDDRCLNAKGDQISVKVKVKDIEGSSGKFEMPNVFTPNGDKVNEYFLLEGTGSMGEPISVLPKDNCVDQFVSVKIINRWGDVVFESKDRDFMWDAKGMAPGVYFYRLPYTNK
jgi:hypothetical protein